MSDHNARILHRQVVGICYITITMSFFAQGFSGGISSLSFRPQAVKTELNNNQSSSLHTLFFMYTIFYVSF